MTNRFTTTDTGRPAPLWYQPTDGPRLYWTDEEWEAQQRIYRKGENSADAIQQAIDTRNHQPVGIQIKRRRGTKEGTCVICGEPFSNGERDQVTCLSDSCLAERKRQRERKSYKKEKVA